MALEESGLKLAAEGAAAYIADLGRADAATGKFVTGLNQAGERVADSGKGFNAFEEAATGSLRRVGEVATDFAGEAAQALGQFIGDSIGQAGDFEAGMNRFGAAAGEGFAAGSEGAKEFSDLFLQLGQELPVSTSAVQEAAITLVKGGLDPAVLAAGGLRDSLQFAAAAEMDLAAAAELSIKQLSTFGPVAGTAAEQTAFMAHANDLLVRAAGASTLNVDELGDALLASAGQARAAGLDYDDFVTGVTLISPAFGSVAEAGTSFKNFLVRLQPATEPAAQAMAELGLLTAEGTSRFYDAEGAFIGVEGAAGLLQGALEGLSEADRVKNLQLIFGNDAMGAAAALAQSGAAGYATLAEKIAATAGVAAQAAARQQGYNTAVDNAQGSLEAFSITAASLALPALTALLNNGISPAINAATSFAAALADPNSGLGEFAAVVTRNVIPALFGLGAATITYAVTQLPTLIATVTASSAAFLAQAAAMAASVAPFVLIAAAVGGVAIAWNEFNTKVDESTTALLESREWWNASTEALNQYNAAQLSTNPNIAAAAATVEQLRAQIEEETASLGRRAAAGLVSEAQYQTEIGAINTKADALVVATGHLNTQVEAENRAAAASLTATAQAGTLTTATAAMGAQASLTAEDIKKLGDDIQQTFQKGGEALAAYVETESEFLSGAEDRRAEHTARVAELEAEKANATTEEQKRAIDDQISALNQSYADQETAQATSYAEQQAAQQAHLGQMLLDYTNAQVSLGNITAEKAAEITGVLVEEYGIQENTAASTFASMAAAIDQYASDSSASTEDLIGTLRDNQQAATETKTAMDAMAKEYVATAVANFVEKGQEAEEYAGVLKAIPKEITTKVVTTYESKGAGPGGTSSGKQGGYDDGGGKAEGGPVAANTSYLVGEEGPEFFVPSVAGVIVPAGISKALLDAASGRIVSPASVNGGGGGTTVIYNESYQISVRDSSLTEAQVEGAFVRALSQRTGRADRLARIGGGS